MGVRGFEGIIPNPNPKNIAGSSFTRYWCISVYIERFGKQSAAYT